MRTPDADELLRSNRSFVMATGHFATELFLPLTSGDLFAREVMMVVGTTVESRQPRWERAVRRWSERLLVTGLSGAGVTAVQRGSAVGVRSVVERLRTPGHAVVVFVDADLTGLGLHGTLQRPFAARPSLSFGTGAAQIARLAGVPIVVCTPYRDDDGVVIEWSAPMTVSDRSQDHHVTSRVLDVIERSVGRHPTSYALRIGGARRWSPGDDEWR